MARLTLLLFVIASMIFISQAGTVQERSIPDPEQMNDEEDSDLAEMFEEGEDVDKDQPGKVANAENAVPAETPEEGEDVDEREPEENANPDEMSEEGPDLDNEEPEGNDNAEVPYQDEMPDEGGEVEKSEPDEIKNAEDADPTLRPPRTVRPLLGTRQPGLQLIRHCHYLCYTCHPICRFHRCHNICYSCRHVCFFIYGKR